MPIKILMPALSPTMTEGNLAKWLKNEGDAVKSGDVIAEIETDKATMEVEAVDEGTLGKILVPGGTEGVKVNEPIALLLEEGEDKSALEGAARRRPAKRHEGQRPRPSRGEGARCAGLAAERRRRPRADDRAPSPRRATASGSPPARWPGAWRRRPGSTSARIKGTGPHGRIVKADIEAALKGGARPAPQPEAEAAPAPAPAPAAAAGTRSGGPLPGAAYDEIPLNNMRKVIARRLTEAKQTIPHFYLTLDCELDALLAHARPAQRPRGCRLQALGQRLRHQGRGAGACARCRASTPPGAATGSTSTRTSTSRSRSRSTAA